MNHDGELNDKDKAYIGSAFPDLMVGINARVAWKNIDFVTNFYGTIAMTFSTRRKDGIPEPVVKMYMPELTTVHGTEKEPAILYPVCLPMILI